MGRVHDRTPSVGVGSSWERRGSDVDVATGAAVHVVHISFPADEKGAGETVERTGDARTRYVVAHLVPHCRIGRTVGCWSGEEG
jgi:hypothetical protein